MLNEPLSEINNPFNFDLIGVGLEQLGINVQNFVYLVLKSTTPLSHQLARRKLPENRNRVSLAVFDPPLGTLWPSPLSATRIVK